LITLLRAHGQSEGSALSAYQRLANASTDESIRYLSRLILEDEERHHRVMGEMLNQLESFVWEVDIGPGVPAVGRAVDPALLEQAKRLLAFERDDAKDLRRLRKALQHSPRSSLLPLLVDLMIHDTAKNVEILKFSLAHARR
jgi:hypothetical protein